MSSISNMMIDVEPCCIRNLDDISYGNQDEKDIVLNF